MPSSEVFRLAAQSSCSAYDCEFVALAMRRGAPLVTYDRRLLSNFPRAAMNGEAFLAG